MRLLATFALALTVAALGAMPVAAQEPIDCGVYRGVACQGFFTDEPGVATDRQRIEDSVARLNEKHQSPFVLVVVQDSRGDNPAVFAAELANAWGVGDPVEENGVLVLVSLDERRVELAAQRNATVSGGDVAAAAAPFFEAGDWDAGLTAIVVTVDQSLSRDAPNDTWGFPSLSTLPFLLIIVALIVAVGGLLIFLAIRRDRQAAPRRWRPCHVGAFRPGPAALRRLCLVGSGRARRGNR